MKLASAALALTLISTAFAQTPQFTDPANLRGERVRPRDGRELPIDGGDPSNTALALQQILRRLSTRASILNIVAHPDDEDGGMLTYYSRGLGARVADLSLTRGEGGQNAMTGDFEDALGLLRTQELLANDRYTGVDQMFGTEADFGFSKTKSEAFAKWTHDRVLYDAVRAVRLYRPLVITSTWIGGVTDGHGQHQVAGQIAQEAFARAGDPTVFPDQIAEGILPWQPLRIYARVPTQSISEKGLFDYATGQYVAPTFTNYVTGEVTHTTPTTDVIVHEGQPDPLLTTAAANPADLDSLTTNHQPLTTPLTYVQFARIGLGLQRSQIPAGFRMPPAGTYDVPYHLYAQVPRGFSLGSHNSLRKEVSNPQGMPSSPDPNFFTGIDTSIAAIATLAPNAPPFLSYQLAILTKKIEIATSTFTLQNPANSTAPLSDALQKCNALIGLTASSNVADSEKESILRELRIKRAQLNDALALVLKPNPDTSLNAPSKQPAFVPQPYFYRNNIEQPVYDLRDPSLRNAPATPSPVTAIHYRYENVTFDINRIVRVDPPTTTYRTIGYGDLPRTIYYPPAPKHVSLTDLKLPTKRRIAYLPGTGDAVPEALTSIGLAPTILTVADLTPSKLSNFDTVILGVRTYAAHPDLHGGPTHALIDYAKTGGNVLLQYQTAEFTTADAPYPLTLGRDAEKVVDETAPVHLLLPAQPGTAPGGIAPPTPSPTPTMEYALLNTPNVITPADFNGWVAERGHGFLRTWDPHYAALTETHDPGSKEEGILPQEPQRGGLITTPLGKGHWTYCAFALYRQLPEAVPGAYRLFLNLINP